MNHPTVFSLFSGLGILPYQGPGKKKKRRKLALWPGLTPFLTGCGRVLRRALAACIYRLRPTNSARPGNMIRIVFLVLFLPPGAASCASLPVASSVHELSPEQLRSDTLDLIFSGQERMHYQVNWSHGPKIGEVSVRIFPAPSQPGAYHIMAQVVSTGPLQAIYPINDRFHCLVSGDMKLPQAYTMLQREGRKGRITTRASIFHQDTHVVRQKKNNNPETLHSVPGQTYNEFSAFFIARALKFTSNQALIPIFASGKRHEVVVRLAGKTKRATIFGEREALELEPLLPFKGLYDKNGKTSIWLSNDRCRVPVEIKTKMRFGALVARLKDYSNPACTELKKEKK